MLAAASLTETFTKLADDFEAEHPGVKVELAFDSSATLAEQVIQGAPADVLATADERTMQTVVDAGAVARRAAARSPRTTLALVVPAGNPAGIDVVRRPRNARREATSPASTRRPAASSPAPCSTATGITARPVSQEVDVKAVLSKVELDEADAGLVYATDAVAAGDKVKAIHVPTSTTT